MIVSCGVLEVRWYREDELPTLAEIHQECFPNENWTEEDFERFVSKRKGQVAKAIVAHSGGGQETVIGSLLYRIANEVRIARLGVRKAHRGQGAGRFAVHELTGPRSVFKARKRFTTLVHEQNKEAWDFWAAVGFAPPATGNLILNHFPAGADGIRRDACVFEHTKTPAIRRLRKPTPVDC